MCQCAGKNVTPLAADKPPDSWGHAYWYVFHTIGEHIGVRNLPALDAELASAINVVVGKLHTVLPCGECRSHTLEYNTQAQVFNATGRTREALRDYVRSYFWEFHNAVRTRKGLAAVDYSPALTEKYSNTIMNGALRSTVLTTCLKHSTDAIVWMNNYKRVLQILRL